MPKSSGCSLRWRRRGSADGKNAAGAAERRKQGEGGARSSSDSLRRLLPAVLYRLGRTQVELKDWAAAIVTLDRLLTEFPENPYRREARYLRASRHCRRGDAAAALIRFFGVTERTTSADGSRRTGPRRFAVKQIQSWIAAETMERGAARRRRDEDKLAASDPRSAELDFAAGQALVGLARLEEARAAFERVIDSSGKGDLGARALLMRGEAYFHQDKLHEALRDFLKVDILYNAPRWQAAALLEAGKVYERLDQWADAAETYGRLLAQVSQGGACCPKRPTASSREQSCRRKWSTRKS